jgi:hypothetical protein
MMSVPVAGAQISAVLCTERHRSFLFLFLEAKVRSCSNHDVVSSGSRRTTWQAPIVSRWTRLRIWALVSKIPKAIWNNAITCSMRKGPIQDKRISRVFWNFRKNYNNFVKCAGIKLTQNYIVAHEWTHLMTPLSRVRFNIKHPMSNGSGGIPSDWDWETWLWKLGWLNDAQSLLLSAFRSLGQEILGIRLCHLNNYKMWLNVYSLQYWG